MRSPRLSYDYWTGMCNRLFGDYLKTDFPMTEQVDITFGGLNQKSERIFFGNGMDDPWQWACMREVQDPELAQVARISECDGCAHCAELYTPKDSDHSELK